MKTIKYLRKKNKKNKTKLKTKGKSKTKSRKIFGGAAPNYIGNEIRRTSEHPLYCRDMECHVASDVLDSFISQYYDQVPFDDFEQITTNTDEIIGYIQTCLQYSRMDITQHFMLSLQCHGHFFAIEIFNGQFRILSSYSGIHSLYEYLTQNAYGHFQEKIEELLFFLTELNSGDQSIIIDAKRNLFGSGATFPNDRITPLTLMTIYKLIKKPIP
jgi:hypothetical protein